MKTKKTNNEHILEVDSNWAKFEEELIQPKSRYETISLNDEKWHMKDEENPLKKIK